MRYVYQEAVQDGRGFAVDLAEVTVYLAGTTTKATIYTAVTGGSADADSVIKTGEDGTYVFYVDEDDYPHSQQFKTVMSKSGYTSETWDYLQIFPDTDRTLITDSTVDQGDSSVTGTLAWHISDVAGADTVIKILDGNHLVSQNITTPSTMTLKPDPGGIFKDDGSNATLTINGGLEAGGYQIFDWGNGSGSVTFGTQISEAFPEWFGSIDGTADETQINLAITALDKGDVILNDQSYTVDASVVGATNVNLRGIEGVTTINIGTADINAFSASSKSNIIISGTKWNGTGVNADTERLVFFTSCTDVKVENSIFTNSIIGVQFETCTRAKVFGNTFTSILRKNDFAQGYGVLTNLHNDDIQVVGNSFNAVARHCVYFSSGTDNSIASNNIAIDSTGTPFSLNSTDAQGVMKNIKIANNIIDGIQAAGGGSDDVYGITATGFISGLQITGNQIYNNDVGGGILIQNAASATNFIKDVLIAGNLIDTVDGGCGIRILNGKKIQILNNQINNVDVAAEAQSGIYVAASGSDTGSDVDEIIIENNIVDTGKYNISVGGVDGTYQVTNLILGDNILTNAVTSRFNMGAIAGITYKTKWESFNPTFYVDNAAANQTDTIMTAGNGSGYNSFIVPFSGWLYSVYGRVNDTITDESILLEFRQNGNNRANGVTISAGDLYKKAVFALGTRSVAEGDVIQMVYTTAAGYLPTTLEIIGGFEIIRDINQ